MTQVLLLGAPIVCVHSHIHDPLPPGIYIYKLIFDRLAVPCASCALNHLALRLLVSAEP